MIMREVGLCQLQTTITGMHFLRMLTDRSLSLRLRENSECGIKTTFHLKTIEYFWRRVEEGLEKINYNVEIKYFIIKKKTTDPQTNSSTVLYRLN